MLTDSIALAPSSTTTALPVATTRSAPCGDSGSWAVLMRMRSPGERAGHEAAVRDGQAVVGRPDHDGEGRVPGFCEQAVLDITRQPGENGDIQVQSGGPYEKGKTIGFPRVTLSLEHFGRVARLREHNVRVEVKLNVKSRRRATRPKC